MSAALRGWWLAGIGAGALIVAATLAGCRGNSPQAGDPHIDVLSPAADVLIHDATPEIIVTYRDDEGDLDPETLRCIIDGDLIPTNAVTFESGALVRVPPGRALGDGRHQLELTIRDRGGHSGRVETTFRISLHAKQTVLKGRVIGSRKGHGIEGLTVRLEGSGISTQTDSDGRFVLRDLPAGRAVLRVFYPEAPGEDTFPWTVQRVPVFIFGGAVNELPREITMVEASTPIQWQIRPEDVDPAGRLLFDLVLQDEASLVGLTLPLGTRVTFADGSHVGHTLALTQLRPDASPVESDVEVPFIYHLGPHGVVIDPPASVTFANFEQDYLAGNSIELRRFNEEAGIYEGYATLTSDTELLSGASILRDSGFYLPAPAAAQGQVIALADDANPIHPGAHPVGLRRGNTLWSWAFPPYQSLGRERTVRLAYSSKRAWPSYTFRMDSVVPTDAPLPDLLEARLSVMGVPIGRSRFFSTEGLTDFSELTSVQTVRLDARFVPSGTYPFTFEIDSHYLASRVWARASGRVTIESGKGPPGLPAGWCLEGPGRLEEGPDGTIVLRDGRETPPAFSISPTDRLRFRMVHEGLDQTVSPVKGTLAVADLYGYGTGVDPTSSNSGLERPNTSIVFLYLDRQRATLSLVMLNDQPGDGTGGRRGYSLFGLPESAYLEVGDDPADDLVVASPDGGLLWEWTPESNDGAVISGLESGFDLTLVPVETEGISAFDLLQGSLTDPQVIHLSKRNGPLRLIARPVAATELPDEIAYLSPPGERSSLRKLPDNTFVRSFPDGAREEYDAEGRLAVSVAANGERTEYAYDSRSRLVAVRDPAGQSFSLEYDGGYLARIIDPSGREATLETDDRGRLIGLEEPGGGRWVFGYDDADLMTSRTDPAGIVTTYEYSPFGVLRRAETREDPLVLEPEESDLLAATDLEGGPHAGFPREDVEAEGFDRGDVVPTVLADEVPCVVREGWDGIIYFDEFDVELPKGGLASTYLFDDGGRITAWTDPGGLTTTLSWDASGLLERLISPAGRTIELDYDQTARLTEIIRQRTADDTATQRVTRFDYDPTSGRLASVQRPAGQQTLFDYDARGRLTAITDGEGRQTRFSHDDTRFESLPTGIERDLATDTASWTLGYDELGNLSELVDPAGRRLLVDRDGTGQIRTLRDGARRRRFLTHDRMGRITSVSGAGIGTTDLAYDAAGRLTRVIDGRHPPGRWFFEYDGIGRVTSVTDPGGLNDLYSYDIVGHLVRADRRNGDALAWDYDPSGRLIQRSLLPALDASELVSVTSDADGRPTAMTDADAKINLTYSGFSEVATVSNLGSAQFPAVTVSLAHDLNGRLVSVDDGTSVRTLGYDDADWLTSVADGESGLTLQVFRDLAGRPGLISLSNGVTVDLTVDRSGRTIGLEDLAASETVSRWSVTEGDGAGAPLAIEEQRKSLGATDHLELGLDAAGRLSERKAEIQNDEIFSYDQSGHRTDHGAVLDTGGRRLSDDIYEYLYDAAGRLIRRDGKQSPHPYDLFAYDVEDHLREVRQFTSSDAVFPAHRLRYRYDPFGRCIEREADGVITRYVWGAGMLLATYASSVENPAANVLADRFIGLGPGSAPLAWRRDTDADGLADETVSLLPDIRGAVADVLDGTLAVRQSVFTSSYGGIERAVDGDGQELDPDDLPIDQPFGLAAGLTESGVGLLRLADRVLDTHTGRFLTENPLGLRAGTNRYGYALENPYRDHDPFGLVPLSLAAGGLETRELGREAGVILGLSGPSLRVTGFLVVDPLHPLPSLEVLAGEPAAFLRERLVVDLPPGAVGALLDGRSGGERGGAVSLEAILGAVGRGGVLPDWVRRTVPQPLTGPLGLLRPVPWVLR